VSTKPRGRSRNLPFHAGTRKAIIAAIGDLHINSTIALLAPETQLDDGLFAYHSTYQRWLWELFQEYTEAVAHKQRAEKAPVVLIINGEIADLLSHPTTQLLSRNPADVERMALNTLANIRQLASLVVVTRGTEAHSGVASNLDETLAGLLQATGDRSKGTYSWYHYCGQIAGVKLDVAHHPGVSHGRRELRGSDAVRLAGIIKDEYYHLNRVNPAIGYPDLVIRGHNHKPSDSGDNHPIRAVINASWQFATKKIGSAFGYKLGGSTFENGGLIITCDSGQYELRKFYRTIDPEYSGAYWWTPEPEAEAAE